MVMADSPRPPRPHPHIDGPARPGVASRRLAGAAMIGVILYIGVDVVLQLLPPYYNPISEAESNLAVGEFGWIMNLNFLGRAVLSACAIAALARVGVPTPLRTVGLVLFGVAGACSAALAFFATDIAPAGEHGVAPATVTGAIHLALATGGFVAALAAFTLLTVWMRRAGVLPGGQRPALLFLLVAIGGILALAVSILVVPGVLGLAERVCLVGILGWVFVVCAAVRQRPAVSPAQPSALRGR